MTLGQIRSYPENTDGIEFIGHRSRAFLGDAFSPGDFALVDSIHQLFSRFLECVVCIPIPFDMQGWWRRFGLYFGSGVVPTPA